MQRDILLFNTIYNSMYKSFDYMKNIVLNTVPQKTLYNVSLQYSSFVTALGIRDQYNKIDDEDLYLGMIPLAHTIDNIMYLKINIVISLLEPFEFDKNMFSEPVTTDEWKKYNIDTFVVSTPDFKPLTFSVLLLCIDRIILELSNNKKIYIHCKAGVGRSASVVVGYIMQKHKLSMNNAIKYVKQFRPSININKNQQIPLIEYQNYLEIPNDEDNIADDNDDVADNNDACCISV